MAKNKDAKVRLGADTTAFTREMKKASGVMKGWKDQTALLGKSLLGMFAAGAVLSGLRSAYMAFDEQEKVNRKLLFALNDNKEAFKELSKQANEIQKSTGVPDDMINQIQMLGASAGKSTGEIKKITAASVELASRTGQDLQAAYLQLNGTLTGSVGKLGKVSKEFSSLTATQLKQGGAIDLVLNKWGGGAKNAASDVDVLNATLGELQESLGRIVALAGNPILKNISSGLSGFARDPEERAETLRKYNENMKIRQFGLLAMDEKTKAMTQQRIKMEEDLKNGIDEATRKIYEQIEAKKKADAQALANYSVIEASLELQADVENMRLETKRKLNDELSKEISLLTQSRSATRTPVFLPGVSDEEGVSDTPGIDTEKIFKTYQDNIEAAKNFTNDMNMILSGGLQEAGMVAAEGFADILSGDASPEEVFKRILDVFGNFLKQMGAAILSYGIAMKAFKMAFKEPIAAVIAGLALMTAGGVVSNLASRGPKAQGMADGGVVPFGYPNDSYPAMLTSGERVIPPGKLGGLGEMITVTGVLRAGDLYISSERGKYLNNRKG